MSKEHIDHQVAQLKRQEGYSATPYRDGNGWSIGYGRRIWIFNDLPENMKSQEETESTATFHLLHGIQKSKGNLKGIFGEWLYPKMEKEHPYRLTALINMVFNLGRTGFLGFNNTIAAILRQDWEGVAYHMLDTKSGFPCMRFLSV